MKTIKKALVLSIILLTNFVCQSQTADEIVNNYFKNIGGKEKFQALNSLKMNIVTNYNGMEIPVEVYNEKSGKMYVKINFQGKEITQLAFDGKMGWSTNFMTMKPEEMDSETSANILNEIADFPDPFLNYKANGYSIEMLGKETKEGTECFKVKLTKKPKTIDGKKVDNVVFYYFETENFVPIMSETEISEGPMKGQMSTSTMGDYQEVKGMYFPFTMNQGGQSMTIKTIELDPKVEASVFEMKKD
uniref:outer membrane lipoprotein-sorting protein n=1 Tax=Flavobacterium sp. TaxID=239 RepID=UPI0040497DA7